jgi:RNA polymerase sigma factor (TIGR02999 family)
MPDPSEVTRLLQELGSRHDAAEQLLPLVYDSLQSIARARLRRERPGHTLQATALVHEAYVRLVGSPPASWRDRAHFLGVASEAMRRVLIDHARRHRSHKRGAGRLPVQLEHLDLADPADLEEVMALDEALGVLEREDARAAEVVKLRFFTGLSIEQAAEALGVSARTVAREWAFARARLFELLGYEPLDPA